MIEGTYNIIVDTPLGTKNGTVVLQRADADLTAEVQVMGLGRQTGSGTAEGDRFTISGTMRAFLLGKIAYTIKGVVDGDILDATCFTDKGDLKIRGTRA